MKKLMLTTALLITVFTVILNATNQTNLDMQKKAINALNKKTKSDIKMMKKRWETKKELFCYFEIGTKIKDMEKITKSKLKLNNEILEICPDDKFYRTQNGCMKFRFKANRLFKKSGCDLMPYPNKDSLSWLFNDRKSASSISEDIMELYGEEFNKLSSTQQKYIINNREIMRRITQQVLSRVARVNIPEDLNVNKNNIVEFYLHPNGDMTDFKFLSKSGYNILDDTSKETIEYAHTKYPIPKEKTLIRYNIYYNLQGNTRGK